MSQWPRSGSTIPGVTGHAARRRRKYVTASTKWCELELALLQKARTAESVSAYSQFYVILIICRSRNLGTF